MLRRQDDTESLPFVRRLLSQLVLTSPSSVGPAGLCESNDSSRSPIGCQPRFSTRNSGFCGRQIDKPSRRERPVACCKYSAKTVSRTYPVCSLWLTSQARTAGKPELLFCLAGASTRLCWPFWHIGNCSDSVTTTFSNIFTDMPTHQNP